jgi:hypothetical protein
MMLTGLILCGLVLAAALAQQAGPGPGAWPPVLMNLRAGHPRLYLTPESLGRLRDAVRTDPVLRPPYAALLADAEALLPQPPVEFKSVGPRMPEPCRASRRRITALALAYLLSDEKKYAARALVEMEAVAARPDWNPAHFLDVAELSAALGIGYDWLHDFMSPEQRAHFSGVLREKGLAPGLACYRGTAEDGWWTRSAGNWNVVCSGGLSVGALAAAEDDPATAAELLEAGLASVRKALDDFGPDGSWRDGPAYGACTLEFAALYLDALRTALGSMMGLDRTGGLAEAGLYRVIGIGPTGRVFNFADSDEPAAFLPAVLWLARTFGCPFYAAEEMTRADGDPLGLVWYGADASAASPLARERAMDQVTAAASHAWFRRDELGFFRSAWNDSQALWLAFKGAAGAGDHRHLDAGTFVLEAAGRRWAVDLGPDDYDLPGYFGPLRWTYYRLSAASHNTLRVDGAAHPPEARASVVAFQGQGDDAWAVVDLSACYPAAGRVHRGFAMLGGRSVLVQDEVQAGAPCDILWGMQTRARVVCAGSEVTLEEGGRRLFGRILAPAGAVFDVASAETPPPQARQDDVRRLVIRLPQRAARLRLAVQFWPERPGEAAPAAAAVRPLAQWPGWFFGPPAGAMDA